MGPRENHLAARPPIRGQRVKLPSLSRSQALPFAIGQSTSAEVTDSRERSNLTLMAQRMSPQRATVHVVLAARAQLDAARIMPAPQGHITYELIRSIVVVPTTLFCLAREMTALF